MIIPNLIQQLAPLWTTRLQTETFKQLRKKNTINSIPLHIANSRYCILGEIHKFRPYYQCYECNGYSSILLNILDKQHNYVKDIIKSRKKISKKCTTIETTLENLAKHLKSEHKLIFITN